MNDPSSVLIAVPVFRPVPEPDEQLALRHINRHLPGRPLAWIAPEGLDLSAYTRLLPDGRAVRFHPDFFRSPGTYSRLLLGAEFYRTFHAHEYLLIHQLDALVFSDQLSAWCARGDAYTGPPWIAHIDGRTRWITGNGGLSLRRIDNALRVLTSRRFTRTLPDALRRHLAHHDIRLRLLPDRWIRGQIPLHEDVIAAPNRWRSMEPSAIRRHLYWAVQGGARDYLARIAYNEDLFWALVAPVFDPAYRVTPAETAVHFAFELEPRWCFERTGGALPFGCHAWRKGDPAFWEPFLIQ